MIEKHMRKVLGQKLENWALSVEDEQVRSIIRNKTIITGGALVSMMQNEKPNDVDVYFKDFNSAKIVAQYYINKFNVRVKTKHVELLTLQNIDEFIKELPNGQAITALANPELIRKALEVGVKDLLDIKAQLDYMADEDGKRLYNFIASSGFAADEDEDTSTETFDNVHDTPEMMKAAEAEAKEEYVPRYKVRYISSNAITLSDKIQIVTRFYGEPDKIHNTYDFVHTKAYYTSWDKKLVIPKEVYHSVMNKVLLYTGSRYPLASLVRTRKFIQRGWTVNAGQYFKIAHQISKLNLDSIAVLQDQLVGVDSAYFNTIITALKNVEHDECKDGYGYDLICSLIDRIF